MEFLGEKPVSQEEQDAMTKEHENAVKDAFE